MIFATVGTHQQPFARLLSALSALPPGQLVVQHGYGPAPAGAARAVAFMSYGEMAEQFEAADAVVTHSGVGSILLAMRVGHTPIAVPRYSRFGEHVDDHQLELTRALAERGHVVPLWAGEDLVAKLAVAPPRRPPPEGRAHPIHMAVRAALRGERDVPCESAAAGGVGPSAG